MSSETPRHPDVTMPGLTRVMASDPASPTFDPSSLPVDHEPRYQLGKEIGRGGL